MKFARHVSLLVLSLFLTVVLGVGGGCAGQRNPGDGDQGPIAADDDNDDTSPGDDDDDNDDNNDSSDDDDDNNDNDNDNDDDDVLWTPIYTGATGNFYGIWGSSSTDVYAVGSGAVHYDGHSWNAVSGLNTLLLRGVSGLSENQVFIAGEAAAGYSALLYFNGSEWTYITRLSVLAPYWGVWARDSDSVFVAGQPIWGDDDAAPNGEILRCNTTTCNTIYNQNWSILYALSGVGISEVYAAGIGTILHFDGSVWSTADSSLTRTWTGVDAFASNIVYAVGYENSGAGVIRHYDGASWSDVPFGASPELEAIWMASASEIFVVGSVGTILHFDGVTWLQMGSGTTKELNGVWGSSASDVYAVGDSGAILHYGG